MYLCSKAHGSDLLIRNFLKMLPKDLWGWLRPRESIQSTSKPRNKAAESAHIQARPPQRPPGFIQPLWFLLFIMWSECGRQSVWCSCFYPSERGTQLSALQREGGKRRRRRNEETKDTSEDSGVRGRHKRGQRSFFKTHHHDRALPLTAPRSVTSNRTAPWSHGCEQIVLPWI